jgi:hypothetical protein
MILSGLISVCGIVRLVMPTKTMSFWGSAQKQVPWAPAHSYVPCRPAFRKQFEKNPDYGTSISDADAARGSDQ